MKFRTLARAGLALLLVAAACGRVTEDGGDETGGLGGALPMGGQSGTGGTLASGGSGALGSGGKIAPTGGVSSSGGSTSTGGKLGSGGAIYTGGTTAKGGTTSSGGFQGGVAGVGGVPGEYVPIGVSSWDVEMGVTVTGTPALPTCKSANFTLHIERNGSGLSVLSGRNGSVMPGEFVFVSGPDPSYKSSDLATLPSYGDCAVPSIQVSTVTLQGWDSDFDGRADWIEGAGKGTATQIQGDLGVSASLSFWLYGEPDTHQPTLLPPATVQPLDGVRLAASEPVALASSVTLKQGATAVLLDGYTASDGAFGVFSSPVVLPFGSTWQIAATGADLAGLPFGAANTAVNVLAEPGFFAQDGFENAPKVALTGNAAIVSAVGTLPAITGTKSLLVPPSARATLHLARPTGANNVRFTVQMLSSSNGVGGGAPPIQAGVVFGTERVNASAPTTTGASSATGDATWGYAGPKQTQSLALTESGSDVVVVVAPAGCFGFCPVPQAVLLDDLRVE